MTVLCSSSSSYVVVLGSTVNGGGYSSFQKGDRGVQISKSKGKDRCLGCYTFFTILYFLQRDLICTKISLHLLWKGDAAFLIGYQYAVHLYCMNVGAYYKKG